MQHSSMHVAKVMKEVMVISGNGEHLVLQDGVPRWDEVEVLLRVAWLLIITVFLH